MRNYQRHYKLRQRLSNEINIPIFYNETEEDNIYIPVDIYNNHQNFSPYKYPNISNNRRNNSPYMPPNRNQVSFRCIYEVKDCYNEIQIINDRILEKIDGMEHVIQNYEIESKIRILNGFQKEELVFKKKFNKPGLNIVDFVIEGQLTDMSYMFNECRSLKKIEFFNIDTSKVKYMISMFKSCDELEYIDLTNFDTSNVKNMKNMFYFCSKLKIIKGINNFNTYNAINMCRMFSNCHELENL